jgi:hypothetical protein
MAQTISWTKPQILTDHMATWDNGKIFQPSLQPAMTTKFWILGLSGSGACNFQKGPFVPFIFANV